MKGCDSGSESGIRGRRHIFCLKNIYSIKISSRSYQDPIIYIYLYMYGICICINDKWNELSRFASADTRTIHTVFELSVIFFIFNVIQAEQS